jgi:choline dehydrogenase-like flavoprotein
MCATGCLERARGALGLYGFGAVPPALLSVAAIYVAQRKPTTRGVVSLRSADASDPPIIRDGWQAGRASVEHDLTSLVDAVNNSIVQLFTRTALPQVLGHGVTLPNGTFGAPLRAFMAAANAAAASLDTGECTIHPLYARTCASGLQCTPTWPPLPVDDPAALREAVRSLVQSSQHCMGTTAVGRVVEGGSLHVRGVHALRVADLSVMNNPIDIHPMACELHRACAQHRAPVSR